MDDKYNLKKGSIFWNVWCDCFRYMHDNIKAVTEADIGKALVDAEDVLQRYAGTVGYDFCREVMAAIINQLERSYPG